MSQLADLYHSSEKQRPKEARGIPLRATDFWDREHTFNDGFKPGQDKLDPSRFTPEARDHFNTQRNSLTPPASYDPINPLHRHTPDSPFFNPGAPTA